jgi:hypothetical protein
LGRGRLRKHHEHRRRRLVVFVFVFVFHAGHDDRRGVRHGRRPKLHRRVRVVGLQLLEQRLFEQ